jgi:putative transposase/transposase-like zinc-binding protein
MRYKHPIRQVLIATRSSWDRPEIRPAVRQNFDKMTKCRTLALGAEVYASETEEKLVPHTCKVRPCPSCGHRATLQWQRERWCALPDVPYMGIVFTMPDVLWPIFQKNRQLLHDLPSLGGAVIQQWAKLKYGVRVPIMVVPHTFGGRLNFNSHLHILVSAGGLRESESRWVNGMAFDGDKDKGKLMHMWRFAVITYLRAAMKAKVLTSDLRPQRLRTCLKKQYERWWSIDVDAFESKEHFLRYAGRYVRRPPIAQYRFLKITDQEVRFWTKDKIRKRRVNISYTPEEFVATLAEHVLDLYQHGIRYFGLLAPRSKARTWAAVFALLGQQKRLRPRQLSWAFLLRRDFGKDPLIDRCGQPMRWVGRLKPQA